MARVTVTSLKPALLSLFGSVSKEMVEAVSDPAVAVARRAMEPIVQNHYDNVVNEIGRKLRGLGMPQNVDGAGVHRLGYGTANGGLGQIVTQHWDALRKRYAGRSPNSLWFWQKQGLNADPMSLSYAYTSKIKGKQKASVWAEHKSKRNHHKGRINVTMTLWFQQLPPPFDSAITKAFAGATEDVGMAPPTGGAGRKQLERARWAEVEGGYRNRPFIRRMSAAMGKEMHKDLAKKLRNL